MSLEQASYLSQIVVALAIVPSLLFVGVQLMQNTKAARTSASQAHAALYHQILASLVDDAEFARIWREALADFEARTPDERVRFLAFTSTLFRFYESSHVQWLRGQLDREHWHTIEQMAASLSAQPGIKAWWAMRRYWHSEKFRRWFEGLAPLPASALYGMSARGPGASADA